MDFAKLSIACRATSVTSTYDRIDAAAVTTVVITYRAARHAVDTATSVVARNSTVAAARDLQETYGLK